MSLTDHIMNLLQPSVVREDNDYIFTRRAHYAHTSAKARRSYGRIFIKFSGNVGHENDEIRTELLPPPGDYVFTPVGLSVCLFV